MNGKFNMPYGTGKNVWWSEQFLEKVKQIEQEIESLEDMECNAPAEIVPQLKERIKLLSILRYQHPETAYRLKRGWKNE